MKAGGSGIFKSRKKSPNLITENASLFNKQVSFNLLESVSFPVYSQDT